MKKIPIYVVVKDSGHLDENGVKSYAIVAFKLTRESADNIAMKMEGAEVLKRYADKQ